MNLQILTGCAMALAATIGVEATSSALHEMASAAPYISELAASIESGEATATASASVKTMLKALETMCTESNGKPVMNRTSSTNFSLSCEGGELGSMSMKSTVDPVTHTWYQSATFDARWAGEVRQMLEQIKLLTPMVPSLSAHSSESEMAIEFQLDPAFAITDMEN